MSNIQREYEICIEALEKKKIERNFARIEIEKIENKPFTIVNLEQRKNELLEMYFVLFNNT